MDYKLEFEFKINFFDDLCWWKITVLKRIIVYIGIVLLPFIMMVVVNTIMETSHHIYEKEQCTRYCHDKGCQHSNIKKNFGAGAEKLYYANIRLLHNNGLGLSYAGANILIYVVLIPLFSAVLLWGIIRKRKE